jgi:tRNA/rRNA methyltransferase/tRNA (cytidine32/uridine32-2'-O)-methyltransferase
MPESLLTAVRLVLFEPQDPVNIAATVRAMKNMGVTRLRLVNPVDYDPFRIEGVAHDTGEIVDSIERYDTLAEAIGDCVRVAGFTARRRSAKLQVATPKDAAQELLRYASEGPIALVFGREDKGLPNSALDTAHVVVTVPTTGHASLNLAQAVLIALYELHLAAGDATRALAPPKKLAPAPTSEQYDLFFRDASRALEEIAFFKTRNDEHIMRSLRSLLFRAAPDARELSLLRAMAIEVMRTVERIRREASGEKS